ncbi:hypothetical protein CDAR_521111 [Caerostris darwini]|uniref:Uncharacterized protein n=1 Tax=Caerostris darwini TaxID=1538125 RepID=A0AAV4VAG8_9ARAC|nr:hypothetical protein CDAR_521111 [Caerostris darwini]
MSGLHSSSTFCQLSKQKGGNKKNHASQKKQHSRRCGVMSAECGQKCRGEMMIKRGVVRSWKVRCGQGWSIPDITIHCCWTELEGRVLFGLPTDPTIRKRFGHREPSQKH